MAWLNTAPVPDKKAPVGDPITRIETMRVDEIDPELPEVEGGQHLINYLFEIGPVLHSGMEAVPITQLELRAWQDNVGIDLHPWEVRLLKHLSHVYLAETHRARKPDCPPPYLPEDVSQQNRDAVARQVKNAMSSYFQAKGKKP